MLILTLLYYFKSKSDSVRKLKFESSAFLLFLLIFVKNVFRPFLAIFHELKLMLVEIKWVAFNLMLPRPKNVIVDMNVNGEHVKAKKLLVLWEYNIIINDILIPQGKLCVALHFLCQAFF